MLYEKMKVCFALECAILLAGTLKIMQQQEKEINFGAILLLINRHSL